MKQSKSIWIFLSFQLLSSAFASPAPSYNWNGFYLGASAGGAFSQFDARTSTQAGSLLDSIQASAVNNAGNQQINASGFLSGFQGGYNWQFNQFLFGFESDIQSLSINGEMNSGAVLYPNQSSTQFVLNSYGNNNWLMTLRPRIGFVANNWLFYATGGLGLALIQGDFIFSNNLAAFESQQVNQVKAGYVVGAGVETGLTDQVSLKAEYLFANFNEINASLMNQHIPAGQSFSNTIKLNSSLIKMGLNYHFNHSTKKTEWLDKSQWETDIGTRLFLSSGTEGAPQPLLAEGMPLVSRLTFSDLTAVTAETFARADHSSGFFAKGYLGAGTVTDGQLNDEDFPAGGAYSNTLSDVSGNLSYATVDLGYSFLQTSAAKIGGFVGYNYYNENYNAYNCEQLAGAMVCVPSSILTNFMGISQEDRYNSLRVGVSSQFDLTDKLTLTSEAAYLPVINYRGTDIHNARQLIGPEQSSHGDGAMLEAVLDYQFSPSWNVGLGGRYWMWNMRSGSVTFDFLGESGTFNQPARYNAERYGVFLQLNYRDKKLNYAETSPVNWRGIFLGGQMGGAWGESNWSDPFGATSATGSLMNVAGFGDEIHSTGPFGGISLNVNWQTGQWVYGFAGGINTADIRGENTLFSGLGGVNGQTVSNYLGTVVGRVGMAFNRSLLYVSGGGAVLNTKYIMNGNTAVLSLGMENQTINTWGWTGGIGVEYALTDHWTSNVEYNYIGFPRQSVSFPSVDVINGQRISARQNLNLFKMGLNYRFDVI